MHKHSDYSTDQLLFKSLVSAIIFFSGYQVYKRHLIINESSGITWLRRAIISYLEYAIFASLALSLHFVWPFLSDGPLLISKSHNLLHLCTESWWHVYLLPFFSGQAITCANHLYLLSTSVHCILIGCIISYLLTKFGHHNTMTLCSWTCTVLLMSSLYTSLMERPAMTPVILQQVTLNNLFNLILTNHFDEIHLLSPIYLHGFLLGMMTAFHVDMRIHLFSFDCVKYTLHLIAGNIFIVIIFLIPSYWCEVCLPGQFYSLRWQLLCQLTLSMFCIFMPHWKYSLLSNNIPFHWRQMIHVIGKFTAPVLLASSIYSQWYFLTNRHLTSHLTRDIVARWMHASYIVSIFSILLSLLIEPFTHHLRSVGRDITTSHHIKDD